MPRRWFSLRGVAAELLLNYLAARRTPRRGKWRIAQFFAPFLDGAIIRSSQGPHLYCRFRDSTFWLAARENQQVASLIDDVGPRDLFVDIGANIGLHACYAASRGATVVALEPSHREFRDLLRNRELLTDDERVRFIALPLAAAARTEFVNFRVNHLSHSGGSSMGEVRDAAEERVVVLSTRVDGVIAQLASHPDFPGVKDAIAR